MHSPPHVTTSLLNHKTQKTQLNQHQSFYLCSLPPSNGFLRKHQRANELELNNLRTTHTRYFLDILFPENLFKWFHVLFLYKEIHFYNFVLEVLTNDTFRNKFCFVFFIRLMLWERWHFRNCWKGTVCFTANYKSRNLQDFRRHSKHLTFTFYKTCIFPLLHFNPRVLFFRSLEYESIVPEV